jgi:hypothetical protein
VTRNARPPKSSDVSQTLRTINLQPSARILSADCSKMPRVGQLTAAFPGFKIKNTVPFSGTISERLVQGHERPRQRH